MAVLDDVRIEMQMGPASSDLITLGIGTPSGIGSFLTFGFLGSGGTSGSAWTAIDSVDVILNESSAIEWSRGNASNRPIDNVAKTGSLEFTLRNDAGNSAGLLGYYSPNHPNCRPGFDRGTVVRLVVTVDGTDYVLWTGKIRVIAPIPGLDGELNTLCLAHDFMGDLAESEIREVARQINESEDTLIEAVFDSLPAESQPLALVLDPGLDVYPVAFDDLGSGERGLGVVERLATSAQGKIFQRGDGTIEYQNRESIALQFRRYIFTELELTGLDVPTDNANVYNRVRTITHPKTFSPSTMVLATHTGTLEILAGATEELWLTYRDPGRPEVTLGGTDFVNPLVAVTDYEFTDGGSPASDLTASVIVTADFFASTVKLTLQNTAGVTAHMVLLQVRGIGIYDQAPVTREAYTAETYGNRPITIDLPYQDDEQVSQAMATYLQASYRDLSRHVNGLEFLALDSDDLLEQAVTREIGDIVSLSESVTLPDGVSAFIQSIAGRITAGPVMTTRFGLAPRIITDVIPASDVGSVTCRDELALITSAPITTIGAARIGFSEIGASL